MKICKLLAIYMFFGVGLGLLAVSAHAGNLGFSISYEDYGHGGDRYYSSGSYRTFYPSHYTTSQYYKNDHRYKDDHRYRLKYHHDRKYRNDDRYYDNGHRLHDRRHSYSEYDRYKYGYGIHNDDRRHFQKHKKQELKHRKQDWKHERKHIKHDARHDWKYDRHSGHDRNHDGRYERY